MQIQLKQSEICQALRMYIMSQGISLAGREVTMAFTAGRKESGISVEIDIEETPELPEFLMRDEDEDTGSEKALRLVGTAPTPILASIAQAVLPTAPALSTLVDEQPEQTVSLALHTAASDGPVPPLEETSGQEAATEEEPVSTKPLASLFG